MTIRYKCEECGAALNIDDDLAGTEGSCPRCHVEFVVPSGEASAPKPAKAEKARSSGSLSTEDEIGDFLSSDEIPVATGRTSLADSDESDSDSDDNPFEDEPPRRRQKSADETDDDAELEAAAKKKSKPKDSGKTDTYDSAAIARTLMGKGEAAAEVAPEPDAKRKRRQFGAGSERSEGEISSFKEMLSYAAKMGWPFIVGGAVVVGLCVWVGMSMMKKLDVPPLAKVTGTLTIDGKPAAPSTIVTFRPEESAKNYKLGSSVGVVDSNGKFMLLYDNDHPGAVIGKHRIVIAPSDPNQGVPLKYTLPSSELVVEVTKDGKPIDIVIQSEPKPEE
ncbi:MAG: hypothetical protein HY290_27875 [Planctomycetia bacterium]|nr:hypothetical protein [Planctomycetia bacterium]